MPYIPVMSARNKLDRLFPALRWLRSYQGAWLMRDIAAGVTLGAVMVPVGLAYGGLAGATMAGLYGSMAPLVVYALFGSSRQIIIGPDTSTSTLVGAILLPLAAGDPARLAVLIAMLALMMGAFCVVAGVLRVGFIADFLAKPVMVGYLHGLSIIILVGQMPKLLGIPGGGETVLDQVAHVVRNLGSVNWPTLLIGIGTMALIVGIRRWTLRIPGQVVALLLSLAAVSLFDLDHAGVAVIGNIPTGLPSLHFPTITLDDVHVVFPIALGAAALAFSDSIVTARSFASRNRYRVDANQELIALGLGNVASAITQGLPVSASASRTAVAESAGSRSQVTSMAAAATVVLVMLFLASHLDKLPSAALAGIMMTAAWDLCDVGEFRRIWDFRGLGAVMAVAVLVTVIAIGIMEGIVLGVVASLVGVLRSLTFPADAVLGRTPEGGFHDMAYRADAQPVEGAVIYRFSGMLFFANCGQFRTRVEELCAPSPRLLVVEASAISDIDFTACEALIEVGDELRKRGIRLAVANLRDRVRESLVRSGVVASFGADAFFPTVAAAVAAADRR